MKKLKKPLVCLLLAALLVSIAGCGGASDAVLQYLDYGIGVNENGQYNAELFMQNGTDLYGADPGCFFVSTEEDATYGGYYYMYITGYIANRPVNLKPEYDGSKCIAYQCYRSQDLNNWDECGVLDGYSLLVDEDDWCSENFWAPEVIRNPSDGKYYMYFSAGYSYGLKGEDLCVTNVDWQDRLTIGVAVSDSPMGPFDVINDIDETTGNKVPTVNFRKGCGTEHDWTTIDASPFFDDDGTLYVYFSKTGGSYYNELKGTWGMKMKSMSEPDYSTVTCLGVMGYESVSSVPGQIESVELGAPYYDTTEGQVNEGPFMVKHNGTYYMTYSSHGYGDPEYSIHQALSDDPLTGFVKVDENSGNPVLKGAQFEYMSGTGHASFARCGDDLWIIYHRHDSVSNFRDRVICADRVQFVENAEGVEVMTANGPSFSLQWRSEEVSGYKNLAKTATITVKGADGAEYLNDELLPYYNVAEDHKVSFDSDVTVTLKWDEPVEVSALMVYNSNKVERAFSQIADIRFKTTAEEDGKPVWKVIKDLAFPERYYDEDSAVYMLCSPAVAEFDTLTVTELRLTVKVSDKLLVASEGLDLAEIVVLGGKTDE